MNVKLLLVSLCTISFAIVQSKPQLFAKFLSLLDGNNENKRVKYPLVQEQEFNNQNYNRELQSRQGEQLYYDQPIASKKITSDNSCVCRCDCCPCCPCSNETEFEYIDK